MTLNFFDPACKTGPYCEPVFGICDDGNQTPAYVDISTPSKWVASVINPNQICFDFHAVDNCVITATMLPGTKRCDGLLVSSEHFYLIELKARSTGTNTHPKDQLESTLLLFLQSHNAPVQRHKKVFVCNPSKSTFTILSQEDKKHFRRHYGFHLDIQPTIMVD